VNSRLSHNDIAAFALDFLRVAPALVADNPARLPGGSHAASAGAAVVAAAEGKLVARVDCFPNDNRGACPAAAHAKPQPPFVAGSPANRNLLCLEHTTGEVSCSLHLQSGSIRAALGEHVLRGQELAKVGGTGAQRVHLHFAVSDLPEPNEPGSFAPLVTFPIAFSDYDVSSDFGAHWRHVARGVPSPGEWLRRASARASAPGSTGKN
jgi:murein DD-endopeptidase MepM/ murein hydrolase activator NlpD